MNKGQFKVGNTINVGKTYSQERKKNIGLATKRALNGGIPLTPEQRRAKCNEYRKQLSKRHRDAVIKAMGGACLRCGFSDQRALQIDHINGGGIKELRGLSHGEDYNVKVLRSFLAKENKYQLLCANCNWIKRFENKEHS